MTSRRTKDARPSVAVVGAGKVGPALGRVIVEEGGQITAVVSRRLSSARSAAAFLRCRIFSESLEAIPPETDLVLIATPHGAVAEVASALAACGTLELSNVSACHASGMLTASALEPLEKRGATVFSFHPLQTFPRDFPVRRLVPRVRGIWYGVDGSAPGLRRARRLARVLRGHILEVPPEARELYHATCVVASNHLTALLAVVERLQDKVLGRRGTLEPFGPILASTIAGVMSTSPAGALSGPVARGGLETIERHLQAVLAAVPGAMPYFTRLTLETIRLADEKGSLAPGRREAMEELVARYIPSTLGSGHRQ